MIAESYVPTREDRFSFGIWTVGWQGRPDADALGRRGMAFERLDQLALEHLYGVR